MHMATKLMGCQQHETKWVCWVDIHVKWVEKSPATIFLPGIWRSTMVPKGSNSALISEYCHQIQWHLWGPVTNRTC